MKLYHFPKPPEGAAVFCDTPTAEDIRRLIDFARTSTSLGSIVTTPGVGKTMALQRYAETEAGARYCVMDPTVRSMSAMFARVCEAVSATPAKVCADTFEIVCNAIRWNGVSVLLIDEAQHLDDRCLDALRSAHDRTGCPIVFAGNYSLRERVNDDGRSAFAQLTSRIGVRIERDGPKTGDVEAVARHRGIRDPKALAWLDRRCQGVSGLRLPSYLLHIARRLAGVGEIKLSHLQDAALVLGGGQ